MRKKQPTFKHKSSINEIGPGGVQGQVQTSFISGQQSDTEGSQGFFMSELPYAGPMMQSIGLDLQQPQDQGSKEDGAINPTTNDKRNKQSHIDIRIKNLNVAQQINTGNGLRRSVSNHQDSSLMEPPSPWTIKASSARGARHDEQYDYLEPNAGASVMATKYNNKTIDIHVNDHKNETVPNQIDASIRFLGNSARQNQGRRMSQQHKNNMLATDHSMKLGSPKAKYQKQTSLIEALTSSQNRASLQVSQKTDQQQFLKTDRFLHISQKKVSFNRGLLDHRNKQLESTRFRQKDLMSCLTSETEKKRLLLAKQRKARKLKLRRQAEQLESGSEKQMSQMLQLGQESIGLAEGEQPHEISMLNSMETALAIPDVYIRKRGFAFVQQRNSFRGNSQPIATEQDETPPSKVMQSVVMSRRHDKLGQVQSSLSDITSGQSSATARSKPNRETVIRNQKLFLNARSDRSGTEASPRVLKPRFQSSKSPKNNKKQTGGKSQSMTRSNPNSARIKQAFNTFSTTCDAKKQSVDIPDGSIVDSSGNFFDSRKNLDRTKTNRTLALPKTDRVRNGSGTETGSFDVLSPKQYNFNQSKGQKQQPQQRGRLVNIQLQRRYTTQVVQQKSQTRLHSMQSSSGPEEDITKPIRRSSGISLGNQSTSTKKNVFQRVASSTAAGSRIQGDSSANVVSNEHQPVSSATQLQSGVFQGKPEIQFTRGCSASNYNKQRRTLAELTHSLATSTSLNRDERSWDKQRGQNRGIQDHYSFKKIDTYYKRGTKAPEADPKITQPPAKSFVKVPDILKQNFNARSINMSSAIELKLQNNLISSQTHLEMKDTQPLNTDRLRMDKINIQDWNVASSTTDVIFTKAKETPTDDYIIVDSQTTSIYDQSVQPQTLIIDSDKALDVILRPEDVGHEQGSQTAQEKAKSSAVVEMFAVEANMPYQQRMVRKRFSNSQQQINHAMNEYESNKADYFSQRFQKPVTELSGEDGDLALNQIGTTSVSNSDIALKEAQTLQIDTRISRSATYQNDETETVEEAQERKKLVQKTTVALESRKGGKILPLSVDKIPQNELQRAIHKLATSHNFNKVAKLKPTEVTEQRWVTRLHDINMEDMDRLLNPPATTEEETQSTKKDTSQEDQPSRVMTQTSVYNSSLALQKKQVNAPQDSVSSLDHSKQLDSKKVITYLPLKLREKVKNPLFQFEKRPDVSEVMFRDIISSYQPIRFIDIHAYENTEDYLSNYRILTAQESVSVDVRIAHDLMSLWQHHIKKEVVKKKKVKKEKKMIYKQMAAHNEGISQDSISLGAHKKDSSQFFESVATLDKRRQGNTRTVALTDSEGPSHLNLLGDSEYHSVDIQPPPAGVASQFKKLKDAPRVKQNVMLLNKLVGIRENCEAAGSQVSGRKLTQMQQKIREINEKKVSIMLTEAATLNTVTSSLEVDFDAILKLQRKLPEYSENRIQNVLPLVIFDDFRDESHTIHEELIRRRKEQLDPVLVTITFKDEFDKRVNDIGTLLDYDTTRQMFIVQAEDKRFFMHRLNIQIEEIESRQMIEQRRVLSMTLSKSVLLRLNVERILFEEVLKLKPEMRQPAHLTNGIESFLQLARMRSQCKQPVEDDLIRELVKQFESLYCFSLCKSVLMSEAEQDEPQVSCMLTSYTVQRHKMHRTPYFGLKAFEKEGKPIDHMISKKDCVEYLQKYTLLGRKCFQDVMNFIVDKTHVLVDTRPVFELPVKEETAYMLHVRPRIKKLFKTRGDIIERLGTFPFNNLEFAEVQQELAKSFSAVCTNIWQDSIVKKIRKMIIDNFGGALTSLSTRDATKINPYILRFLKSINQVQVNHLYAKYELELRGFLEFLLSFANLSYDFRAQQSYLDYGLDKFDVHFSQVPLIESLVSVKALEIINVDQFKDVIPEYVPRKPNENPFIEALQRIKPHHAGQSIQSSPTLENIYLQLFKTLNNLMFQFTRIPSVPSEIYPNANLSSKYILVSPDLKKCDMQLSSQEISSVIESVQSQKSIKSFQSMKEQDQVYTLRKQIEYVMTDIIQKANVQLLKLKPYVKFIGYRFSDMIHDLKSLMFRKQTDIKMKSDDDDFTQMIDFAADLETQNARLLELVEKQEITDQTYMKQYDELQTAYWKVQMEVHDYYNFGLVRLDCREFKQQAEAGIRSLIENFKAHLLEEFQSMNTEQTEKNIECWAKVNAIHKDIDATIEQIDYVHQLQNDEFFEDMITFVRYVASKKKFLDELRINTSEIDLHKFLDLHHFPSKLKKQLNIKDRELRVEQKKIQQHISMHTVDTKKTLDGFNKNFKQFRQYILPTKQEFINQMTEDTKDYVLGTLEKLAEDGHALMADEYIWDSQLVDDLTKKIDALNDKLRTVEEDTRTINRRQEALQMKLSDFPELYDLKQRIKPLVQMWETIAQFNSMMEEWKEKHISYLNVDEIEEFCSEWYRKLLFVMRNSDLTKHAGPKAFADYIMKEIDNMRQYLPLLSCFKVNGLDRRHWMAISKEVGETVWPNKITMRWLAKRDLHKGRKYDVVKAITDQASKEYAIRLTIEAVEQELDTTKMSPVKYRDSFILKNLGRDLSSFTECTLKINSIASNPAARTFRERIERLMKELNRILHFFNLWNDLQKYWAYLLPIFNQRDIAQHMPEQYEKFVLIDRIYRREVAYSESLCRTYRKFSKRDSLRENINIMMSQFEYLMKCLINYLEKKREYFPRLYFLSNEQIIEIVGMLEDISQLERNLFKMFEGIDKLIIVYQEDYRRLRLDRQDSKTSSNSAMSMMDGGKVQGSKRKKTHTVKIWRAQDTRLFKQGLQTCLGTRPVRELGEDLGRILGVSNQEGELLEFAQPVKITQTIEQWLKRAEYSMKYNVARTVQQAYDSFCNVEFGEWIQLWPTQFLLTVLEIDLTQSLESIFVYEISLKTYKRALALLHGKEHKLPKNCQKPIPPMDEKRRVIPSAQGFQNKQTIVLKQITLLSSKIRDQLSNSMRQRINSLIINRVHSRDVIQSMLDHKIEKSTDFLWNIHLKYVYKENIPAAKLEERQKLDDEMERQKLSSKGAHGHYKKIVIQTAKQKNISTDDLKAQMAKNQADDQERRKQKEISNLAELSQEHYPINVRLRLIEAEHEYGYEFLSNSARLVISPLTERCFQSLFLALHYKYGGAPIGPAGTGKTESIKEMGKNIARHCYVFNCQGQIDYMSMSKFFKGLSANGTWVCFDEFNRLEINVLAIISQLIIALSDAKHENSKEIQIEETVLPFDSNCGLFITMNPFNYGRTPLPDNLKALFRQITMVEPDTRFISEILLYSVGFANARNLSIKITRTFQQISQQLQGEIHYDFGLRTVKQVLIFAGELKLRCIKVRSRDQLEADINTEALKEYTATIVRSSPAKRRMTIPVLKKQSSTKAMHLNLLDNLRATANEKTETHEQNMIVMDVVEDGPTKKKDKSSASSYSNVGTVKDSSFTDSYVPKPIADEDGQEELRADGSNFTIAEESDASSMDSEELSSSDESKDDTSFDSSDNRGDAKRKQKKGAKSKKNDSQLEEPAVEDQEESSAHSDDSEFERMGLDRNFILKELGCTTKKVFRSEELLDQFIVLKAILDINLPKLVFKDMQILQHIVNDVFPQINMTQVIGGGKANIISAICERLERRNFHRGKQFVQNVFNIYEALESRHGIMVLGQAAAGKTTCIRIVQDVLQTLHTKEMSAKELVFKKQKAAQLGIAVVMNNEELVPKDKSDSTLLAKLELKEEESRLILGTCVFKGVSNYSLNPKSVTMSQLMGFFDDTSREWTDGVLSSSIRQCSQEGTGRRMIVTCDGPIEPDWVENLNSVLDDNKRLSLQTGETIYLTPHMNILLETSHLLYATPATISRVAICYIRREILPAKATFNNYLYSLPQILYDQKEKLDQYANYFLNQIFENFFHVEHLIYPITPMWAIVTFIRLFDSLIFQYRNEKYGDARITKKIFNRMQIEETVKETKRKALIVRRAKTKVIEDKQNATRFRLEKMKRSGTFTETQLSNFKKELLNESTTSEKVSDSESCQSGINSEDLVSKHKDADSDDELQDQITEKSDEESSSEGQSYSLLSDAKNESGVASVSEYDSGKIKNQASQVVSSSHSVVSTKRKVSQASMRKEKKTKNQFQRRHTMKLHEGQNQTTREMAKNTLSSKVRRTITDPDLLLKVSDDVKAEQQERTKPPEHSFVDNDFLFEQSLRFKNLWIDSFFLYSLIWAFGSILTDKARKYFNTWLHQQMEQKNYQRLEMELAKDDEEMEKHMQSNVGGSSLSVDPEKSEHRKFKSADSDNESVNSLVMYSPTEDFMIGSIALMEADLPEGYVFDIFFDVSVGRFQNWHSVFNYINEERSSNNAKRSLMSMTVITQDYLRLEYILNRQLEIKKPLMLLGPTAQGKSYMMRQYVCEQDIPLKLQRYDQVGFSTVTDGRRLQAIMEQRLEKQTKTLIKPPGEKHQVFFIDDLHMAHTDKWNVQSANELFRQYLDYGGWYNTDKIYFKKVRDVNFVVTISTRQKNKELVSERTGWHLSAIGVLNGDGSNIEQIYNAILSKAFMNANSNQILHQAPSLLYKASMEFYNRYTEQLKPSPTMFLFKINQRHLLYLLKGFIDAPITYFQVIEHIAFMWVSEISRTVLDRYADASEQDRLYEMVKSIAADVFHIRPKILPRDCQTVQFFYGQPESEMVYNEKCEEKKLVSLMNDTLEAYNKSHHSSQISVIIFNSLIEKTLKINRSILMPMTNTILVAEQGCGAYELVKISIQLAKATDHHLFASDSEHSEDWKTTLKNIIYKAGIEERNTCVLHMIENHIEENVLETLEAIAAHGELFQLFNTEELDALINQNRYKHVQTSVRSKEKTDSQLTEDIREIIHTHLHMLLQLTPRSKILLNKLRECQHLLDTSTLIYFGEWSDYGFEYIATKHLEGCNQDRDEQPLDDVKLLTKAMIDMYHDTSKQSIVYYQETDHYIYVTPQLFETFMQTFKRLFQRRAAKLMKHRDRFRVGLEGIRRTQVFTEAKQDELSKQSPLLVEKQRSIEDLVDKLDIQKKQIQKQITLKLQVEDDICNFVKEAKSIQKQCDKCMHTATPVFKNAVEGLLQITKKEVDELKSIVRPLPTVRTLMTAVCLILDEPPTLVTTKENNYMPVKDYWTTVISSRVLAGRAIIQRMTQIDPTQISANTMRQLEALIDTGEITPEKVKRATYATRGIFSWVMAVRNYFYVYKSSEPLRNKLILADRQLQDYQRRKIANEVVLCELEARLKNLSEQHSEKEFEVKNFQKEIEEVFVLKSKSARLLNELAAEKQKWLVCENVATINIDNMQGDSLISAAMVCLLASFTQKTRESLLKRWLNKIGDMGIAVTVKLDFNSMFSNPLKVKMWLENGLPNDSYSIQNAIILKSAQLQPILIDPQTQANKWLRKELHDVKLLNMQTSRFLQELKMCIKFGNTVIIENVDETISNKLYPLFLYEKAKVQGQRKNVTIVIDQTSIQIDPSFKLYITSVHPNPDFGADVSLLSNFINFSSTIEAFEAQIMALLLSELETEQDAKQRIYRRQALVWIKRLKVIEDEILDELKKDQPQELLIKREFLIEKLMESRTVTKQTGKTLTEINSAMQLLIMTSKMYKPVSQRASKFFFVASSMVKINNMYQFTHEWFISFFTKLVSETLIDDTNQKKKEESIRKLQANFVRVFYHQVCQTLFDKDKLLFSFLLSHKELEVEFKLDKRQVEFFIKGGKPQEEEIFNTKNLSSDPKDDDEIQTQFKQEEKIAKSREQKIPWIKRKQWIAIDKLSKLVPFNQPNNENPEPNLASHVEKYPDLWLSYVNGKQILEYTMDTFTLKDDDGNSIHYSESEEEEELDGVPAVQTKKEEAKNISISSGELLSAQSFSSLSSFDAQSKKPSSKKEDSVKAPTQFSSSIDLSQRGRNKSRMTSKVIRRVCTQRHIDLGVPGGYDKYNYEAAIKQNQQMKQDQEQKAKSDYFLNQKLEVQEQVLKEEKSRYQKELDDIFALDDSSDPDVSSSSLDMDSHKSEQQDNRNAGNGDGPAIKVSVDDAKGSVDMFDDLQKNNIDEDQRIALAIIQGIAEYAEFKVNRKPKLTKRQKMKQDVINSHMVRLCIMRCFHPDKLYGEIKSFISFFLGRNFTEQPPFEFISIFKQTSKYVPILLMLGPNVNPYTELKSLKMIQPQTQTIKLDFQPMGQIALERISKKIIVAACEGNWCLLDNLQLSLEITANLHKFLENMYLHSKEIKQQLLNKAKIELKDILVRKNKNEVDTSANQDSAVAMELMLLQQSILQDSAETSFNGAHEDRSWHQDVSVQDKSFSISLALQDKLCSIIRRRKHEARLELIEHLQDYERQQKEADEKSQMRELTNEEKLMKELVFPEKLAFPIHKQFRLWMSVIPVPQFPANFSRRCLKLSLELPVDIRPNTIKSINLLPPTEVLAVSQNAREFKRMLFAMTVMHAVINQRERFGSFGWTQPYFFSPTDLQISSKMLAEMCQNQKVPGHIPLTLLRYVVGTLNYGGKLTHKEDQSILSLQIKTFINKRVFTDITKTATTLNEESTALLPYDLTGTQSDPLAEVNQFGERFFQIEEAGQRVRGYWVPQNVHDLRGMKEHVRESFPLEDAPEIFGLHHNATIDSNLSMAETIMIRTYSYQFVIKRPKQPTLNQAQSSKRSSMIFEYFRNKLNEIIVKIPQPVPVESFEEAIPLDRDKPFNTLLTKEIQRYNTLLETIRKNLDNTHAAMEGIRQHADDTENTFECLQQDRVPYSWSQYCYPCHDTMSGFVDNLVQRVSYIKSLLEQAAQDKFSTRKFWLPGFFNQRNLIMTIMQEVSRKNKISIESLVINFRIMAAGERMFSQVKAVGTNSYYIDGLYIYGACWDENEQTLSDLPKFAPSGSALPLIHLMVVQQQLAGESDISEDESVEAPTKDRPNPQGTVPEFMSNEAYQLHLYKKTQYMCPVYVNFSLNRNEVSNNVAGARIVTIPIPIKHRKPEFWIKRNICILCYNESAIE